MATLLYFRGDETGYGFLGGYTLFTVASMLLLLQGLSVVLWYVQVRGNRVLVSLGSPYQFRDSPCFPVPRGHGSH